MVKHSRRFSLALRALPSTQYSDWRFRRGGIAVALAGVMVFWGCSSARYRAVDFEAAEARAKAVKAYTNPNNRDQSLVSFDVVTLGSLIPDPWSVREALGNIESNASGNPGQLAGAISLATWEGTRVYLGDTFERAYASFVGSTAYWMLGEDDNAAALWRNTLDIDRESARGYQEDFSVAQYLLAKYYWNRPGQRDTAAIYLRAVQAAWPGNPYLTPEHLENDNLIVLVEAGDGPRKITTGPQGSILDWEPGPSRGGEVTVGVDDGPVARAWQVLDLYVQAKYSLRPTGKKALQVIKGAAVAAGVGYAVYKLTDDPGLGVLAALVLQLMPADTRQWWGVPGQVQMASFRVEPGRHRVRVNCYVWSSYVHPGEQTVLPEVEVSDRRDTIVLIRPVTWLRDRRAMPPPGVPTSSGIAPDPKSPAAPGSPTLDIDSVDLVLRSRSPLYKYLPSREEIRSIPGPETPEAAVAPAP